MTKFKKTLSLLLVLCLVVGMLPMTAFATPNGGMEEVVHVNDSNSCGDKLSWSLEDGILTVSGTGPMYDYSWQLSEDLWEYLDVPWYSQREDISKIVIEEGVTHIGANAFSGCSNVSDVELAESIEDIGDGAFDGCGPNDDVMPLSNNTIPTPPDGTTDNVRYSVVVLDISGSMSSRPMAAQKASAIKFCEALLAADGYNYVAIVTFGSSVHVASQFSNDVDSLKTAINGISTTGATNTIGALEKADELLTAVPDTAGRSIVLCSDGLPNVGSTSSVGPFTSADSSRYYDYANAVHNKSVELMQKYDVFTLGFFHDLSSSEQSFARKFMEAIQDAGYYEVTDPDDLEFTFGDIAGDVVTPGHSGIIFTSVPKDKYVLHVVSDSGRNLPNVEVTCNGTVGKTNSYGLVQFDKTLFASTPTITAKATGYIDWSNKDSNWDWSDKSYTTIKMLPTTANGLTLSECHYYNSSDMSYKNDILTPNLLTRTKTVSLGNDLPLAGDLDFGNFYISCKANKTDTVTEYQLWQGTKKISASSDGTFDLHFDKTGAPFVEGGKCFIRVVGTDGTYADTAINLQFKKNEINKNTEVSFSGGSGGSGISFKVGDDIPFFGGSTFDIDLPVKIPIYVDASPDGKKIQIGLNLKKDWDKADEKKDKKPIDELKEAFSDARSVDHLGFKKNLTKRQLNAFEKLQNKHNEMKLFKKGSLDFLGYAEADFNESTAKGYAMLKATILKGGFNYTGWCIVVPVTVQVDYNVEAHIAGEIGYDWANAQFIGSIDVGASGTLTAFGGVGVGKAIGAGAYGSATLAGELRIVGNPWGPRSVDLTGELGLKAYVAWIKYERPFAYNTWNLYTANNVRSLADEESSIPMAASLYDSDNYQVHDLSYLSEESEWISSPISLYSATAGTNLSPLQTDTYRNAQPMMITANNTLYATFLKADAATGNVYTVVTKLDNGSWVEPVQVDNTAVMDAAPSLCVDSNGTIWLAYAKTLTSGLDSANPSLSGYAKNQQVVVGKIDASTLAFTESKAYTSDADSYAHLQRVSVVNGTPTLVWAESPVTDDNSVLWATSSKLYSATYTGGSWSEKQIKAEVNKPVLQIAAGDGVIGYIADADGSYNTGDDHNLYSSSDGNTVLATDVQGKLTYDTVPGSSNSSFVWNTENTLKTSDGAEVSAVGITQEYAIAGNRIYYSAAGDDGGAHLTTVIYDNGQWSAPVTLTGGERYLENLSVVNMDNHDYVMGMDTLATIGDDSVDDAKNLVYSQVQPTSNLVIDGLDYSADDIAAGDTVPVTLTVVNAGDHEVTSVDVSVGSNAPETKTVSIAPGASADITVNVICPTMLTDYEFSISETGQADYSPEDNTASIGIGYSDIEISVAEERIGNRSSLVVYVTNKGVAPASGTITVTNSEDSPIRNSRFENLAAGDTVVISYPLSNADVYTATATLNVGDTDLYTYNNSDATSVGVPTYTVTLDPCGGTVSPSSMRTDAQGRIASLPTPVREGYTFLGWYTSPNNGTVITASAEFTTNTTIYAQWSRSGSSGGGYYPPAVSYYTIAVSSSDHGSVIAKPTNVYSGGTVTLTVNPDAGYKLDKITVTDSQGKAVELTEKAGKYTFKMPSRNVTVTAKFVPEQTATPTPSPDATPTPTPDATPTPDTSPTPQPWKNPFPDVSDTSWYIKAVEYVAVEGLMHGYPNGKFGPNDNISRAEFAQIIYNKAGRPNAGSSVFTDVKTGQWYTNAVTWAAEQKVVSGIGNNQFAPNRDISREELATMLWRYAGSPNPVKTSLSFTDAGKVSNFAKKAMLWANENGIVAGKGNGVLDPKGKATRAETAQMLMNYLKK